MPKVPTNNLTRGDKMHLKNMDKLNAVKDTAIHGIDSFTKVHKQIIDSDGDYLEKVANSQKDEKAQLYEIIKTSDDEKKREEAYNRLKELEYIADERIKKHNELSKSEGEKTNNNIASSVALVVTIACGALYGKQIKQKLVSISKNLLPGK